MPKRITLDDFPGGRAPGEEHIPDDDIPLETDISNEPSFASIPVTETPFDTLGKIQCDECGEWFSERGINRHRNTKHGIVMTDSEKRNEKRSRSSENFATRWAEFQRGCALMVSFACSDCAAVLIEDADVDAKAIADYCSNRPKLRRQLESALSGMDLMILVGTLGGTGKKMVEHHEIGKRIGLRGTKEHTEEHGAAERMMGFLSRLDPNARTEILNGVFDAHAAANSNSHKVQETPVTNNEEPLPGQPPSGNERYTEADLWAMKVASNNTGELSQTG
jgi:hypothetical protein